LNNLKMKKHISKLIVFIFGIGCLSISSSEISPFPFKESSLFWEIKNPNSNKKSYLFGTMHLIEKEYFIFPKSLKETVASADLLLMELDRIPSPTEAMPLMTLNKGSFFDFFSSEQVDSILGWAKKDMKMDEQTFRKVFYKLKPFVAVQIAVQLQFSGKIESYEKSFFEISKSKDILTEGLETIEEQMSLFDGLNKSEQAEMVMENIRNPKKSIELLKRMQQTYSRQNVDSLYLLIHEETSFINAKEADFIDNRNQKWIPKIIQKLSSKSCFIAVGAGHLGGQMGLIRLLQKEGYTLTPIKLK